MDKVKNSSKKVIGIAMAAIMVTLIFGAVVPAVVAGPSIPPGDQGIYFLVPRDSGAAQQGSDVTIDVFVNHSVTDLKSGGAVIETSDKLCGNITSSWCNGTQWPQANIAVVELNGKKARFTYGGNGGTGTENPPGEYPIGTITVENNCSTFGIADLNFIPGLPNTYVDNDPLNGGGTFGVGGDNGTFRCGSGCMNATGHVYGPGDLVNDSCVMVGNMNCADSTQHGLIINADNVVIEGYNASSSFYGITGPGCDGVNYIAGIYNPDFDHVQVNNLTVTGFCDGIRLGSSGKQIVDNTIYNCTVHDNGNASCPIAGEKCHGINLFPEVSQSTIDHCTIYSNTGNTTGGCDDGGMGIRLKDKCDHNDITNNTIFGNTRAGVLSKMQCKFGYLANNHVYGNGELVGGVLNYTGGGIRLQCKNTNNWTLVSNTVSDNFGPGIFVRGQNNTVGPDNTANDNKDASAKMGKFTGRGYGIVLTSESKNNNVSNNMRCFCSNEFADVSDQGTNNEGHNNVYDTSNPLGNFDAPAGPCTPITIRVEPTTTTVTPGTPFSVNIYVDTSNTEEVFAVEYKLTYNASVLQATNLIKGGFLGASTHVYEYAYGSGEVSYGESMIDGDCTTTSGVLSTIEFTAIGANGTMSELDFDLSFTEIIDCNITSPTFSHENGTVNILAAAANQPPVASGMTMFRNNYKKGSYWGCAADLCACNSSDPDSDNIATIYWDFGIGATVTTAGVPCWLEHEYQNYDWNGTASAYEPFNASVTVVDDGSPAEMSTTYYYDVLVYYPGDVVHDCIVDIKDGAWVSKYWNMAGAGYNSTAPTYLYQAGTGCFYRWADPAHDAADINHDGKVDIADGAIVTQEFWNTC